MYQLTYKKYDIVNKKWTDITHFCKTFTILTLALQDYGNEVCAKELKIVELI